VQQYPVRAGGHPYQLDFAWPDRMVVVEYNGLAVHSGASAVAHDNERMSELSALGWRVLVFDETTPARRIVEQVTKLLATSPTVGDVEHRMSA
jgi:very-short-patch-repair endonuclease